MKTLTNAVSEAIRKKTGLEPVMLLEVQIPDSYLYFSDKKINKNNINWVGKILSVGNLQTEEKAEGVGDISTIAVSVEDSTDQLRGLLNQQRFVGRFVKIYHCYEGVSGDILLFTGKLTTPLEWVEESKTLNFEAITKINSREVGIPVDADDYTGAVTGVAPVGFGTVLKACLPKIYDVPDVRLVNDWGDFGNWVRIPTAWLPTGWYGYDIHALDVQRAYGDYDFILSTEYWKWLPYIQTTIAITDSTGLFPQNTEIDLFFGDEYGKFKGIFNGTTLTITQWQRQYGNVSANKWARGKDDYGSYFVIPKNSIDSSIDISKCCFWYKPKKYRNPVFDGTIADNNKVIQIIWARDEPDSHPEFEGESWRCYINDSYGDFLNTVNLEIYAANMFGWWKLPANTLLYAEDVDYVEAYALPVNGYSDLKIYAWQTVNDIKELHEIPTGSYRITTNYRDLGFDAVELIYPMSTYNQEVKDQFKSTWGNELYFSFTSNIGTNVSDIIKWILQTYTDLAIDQASFDKVHDLVDKYPANFMVSETKDAITLVSEIAWQARCAINIVNGIAYIKYLSKRPDPLTDVRDDEIEEASVVLHYDSEEEVVTHLTANWKKDCLANKDTELVYKNNVDVYGLQKQSYTFYIYAHQQLIQKSLTFWGNRYSNIWKRVKYNTFLSTLPLEYLDALMIRSSLHESLALVEDMAFDSEANLISYDHWTPWLIGTNEESSLAWLNDSEDVKPDDPVIISIPPVVFTYTIAINPIDKPTTDEYPVYPAIALNDQDENGNIAADLYPDGYDNYATKRVNAVVVGDTKIKKDDRITVYKQDDIYYAVSSGAGGGVPAKTTTTVNTTTGELKVDLYENGYEQPATATDKTAYSLNKTQISLGKEVTASDVNGTYQVASSTANDDFTIARVISYDSIEASGPKTIDGIAVAQDDIVFIRTNGRYKVNLSGSWTFIDRPAFVVIQSGTSYARTAWVRIAPTSYSAFAAIPV